MGYLGGFYSYLREAIPCVDCDKYEPLTIDKKI